MRDFCATIGISAVVTNSIRELQDAVSSLRARGVTCLDPIDSTALWTLEPQIGQQKRVTAELQNMRRRAALASLPSGPPRSGVAVNQALTPNETAIRRQGITNLTCRDSGQWLNANPAYIHNKMNNAAFNLAIQLVLLLEGIAGSRTNCVCGAVTDCFFDHALVCPVVTVRNQTRNTAHSDVSHGLRNVLQARQHSGGGYYVAHGEPLMDNYFPRLPATAAAPELDIARRADIALIATTPDRVGVTLIDVTLAAHNSQHANLDFSVGGAGILSAQRKHAFYNRMYDTSNADAALVIFAIETSGHLHSEARKFLKDHITASAPHNPGLEFGNILKTVSVSVQTARVRGILTARTKLTLDQPPTYPYIGGPLALPTPPAFLSSIEIPRHNAVVPLSRRPTSVLPHLHAPPPAIHAYAAASTSRHPPPAAASASFHPPVTTSLPSLANSSTSYNPPSAIASDFSHPPTTATTTHTPPTTTSSSLHAPATASSSIHPPMTASTSRPLAIAPSDYLHPPAAASTFLRTTADTSASQYPPTDVAAPLQPIATASLHHTSSRLLPASASTFFHPSLIDNIVVTIPNTTVRIPSSTP